MQDDFSLADIALKYNDDASARALIESRLWPKGPVCPHCKSKRVFRLAPKADSKSPCRQGLLKCQDCRKQFTVTVGTIFEKSKVPLTKWLMAISVLCSSKKGMSAHQLHRMIGVDYKTAWFMFHRLRHAMQQQPLKEALKGIVEADEAFLGGKDSGKRGRPGKNSKKTTVVALVQRGGPARVQFIPCVSAGNLKQVVSQIDLSATVNTDQANYYHNLLWDWARHDVVNHSKKEFKRYNADGSVSHVNTAESLFSLIKRGLVGSFHHVSKEHLPKYLDEFVFRWDRRKLTDGERAMQMIQATAGKRLMYRETALCGGAK